MSEAISSSKYGVVVMADLEDAFDRVWRDGAIYKFYEAAIRNNMLSVFDSFLGDHFSRNLVNVYSSNWVQTHMYIPGIPFKSIHLPCLQFRSNMEEETPDSNHAKNNKKPKIQENQNVQTTWSSGGFIQIFINY